MVLLAFLQDHRNECMFSYDTDQPTRLPIQVEVVDANFPAPLFEAMPSLLLLKLAFATPLPLQPSLARTARIR